jgi:carbon storage regulator
MLVLSRRVGESLVIGDEITITVLEQRGDVVRIGVDAPRHIQVRRQELLAEVAETNRAAASPAAGAVAGLSRLVSGVVAAPAPVAAPTPAPAAAPTPAPAAAPGPRPGPPRSTSPRPTPPPSRSDDGA